MSHHSHSFPLRVTGSLVAALSFAGAPSAQAFHEQARVSANDAVPDARFGCSVALEGDTAVVGAYRDSRPNLYLAGAAYVLTRSGGVWSETARLAAVDADEWDAFGGSVALSGDTLLVGAQTDDVWYFGALKIDTGSARVLVRTGGAWSEQAVLTKRVPGGDERFGSSVALRGDTAIVGASRDRNLGSSPGAAYVFVRSSTSWSEEARLLASDGAHGDSFGVAVALDGDTAVVGALGDSGTLRGAAYVFVRAGSLWTEQAKLVPSDGELADSFGECVAIAGDTVLVGAWSKDAPGVPGSFSGAAYVFTRSAGSWSEQQELVLADPLPADRFGSSVALSGERALIGAPGRLGGSGSAHDEGAAFVFERTGAAWAETARLAPGDDARGLGSAVALAGDELLVGAEDDDHCAGHEGSLYVFGPTPGPVHPRILSVTPTSTPALVPGTARTVSITGTDLHLTTGLLLDCVPVDPAHYAILGPTHIALDMPQASSLGDHYIAVTDGAHVDSVRIHIVNLLGSVHELGSGDPANVVDRDDGLRFLVGGPVGSVHYLFASPSDLPSVGPTVRLDLGNGFTQLFQVGRYVIPDAGWIETHVPSALLPDPGPNGLVLFSQSAKRQGRFPLPVSGLQSIRLVQ